MIAIISAITIGAAHFIGDHFRISSLEGRKELASLTGGIAVAYLLLHLFPLLYEGISVLNRGIFLFALGGFVLIHLVEKYVYKKYPPAQLPQEIDIMHSYAMAGYYFVVGFVLVNLAALGNFELFLFVVPVALYTLLSSFSTHAIHGAQYHSSKSIRLNTLIAAMPFAGAISANFVTISQNVFYSLFAFVAGVMMYIFVRDTIPAENEGNPTFFLIGAIAYSLLIYAIWFF